MCSQAEQDEEQMGDLDLWTLTPDGKALTVNAKWLQHLQDRLLGEGGDPRKVRHTHTQCALTPATDQEPLPCPTHTRARTWLHLHWRRPGTATADAADGATNNSNNQLLQVLQLSSVCHFCVCCLPDTPTHLGPAPFSNKLSLDCIALDFLGCFRILPVVSLWKFFLWDIL